MAGSDDGTLLDTESTAPSPLELSYAPGDRIADRYEVVACLGTGASASVYRVFDHASREEIAVKLIADPAGGLDKLRREVQLARKVTHPNVCRAFDIASHRHGALLSMELAAGTLADHTGAPVAPNEVREIAAQVLAGLEAAHAAGVVHRDLKPANVLRAIDGRWMLADFGVARPSDAVVETEEGRAVGTPAYMAPEQLRGEPTDARTDLYAVGLILYELLAGHLPHVEPGAVVTLPAALRRLDQDPPAPAAGALGAGVLALLARDPTDRPANARAARVALGLDATPPRAARAWLIAGGIAALAAAGAAWQLTRDAGAPTRAVAPATRAVTGADEHIAAPVAFTADGSAMIVATDRGGSEQLWLVSVDRAAQRQLTRGARPARQPQLSGDWLYYLLGDELVRVPARRVDDADGWDGSDAEPVAGGVAYAHVGPHGRLAAVEPNAPHRLVVVEPGGRRRDLVTAEHPIGSAQWSPDGAAIAFGDRPWGEARAAVWLVDVATGARRRVADADGFTGLAWTADGAGLVLLRGRGARRSLVRVDVATGRARELMTRLDDAALPALSPDGRLAYLIDTWSFDLWLLDGGGELRRITFLGDDAVVAPHWDGATGALIYGVRRPNQPGLELLRATGADFAAITPIRTIPATHDSLALAPDGVRVAFAARDADRYLLQWAALDSDAPPATVLASDDQLLPLQFTPAGRVSFVDMGAGGIWDVALDGSPARQLVRDGAGGFHALDGRWLAYGRGGTATGVWIEGKRADGTPDGRARPVPGERVVINTRWHPTTHELVVMDARELAAVDPLTLRRRPLAAWPPTVREPGQLAVAPDGRVACSLATGRTTVHVLDNFDDL